MYQAFRNLTLALIALIGVSKSFAGVPKVEKRVYLIDRSFDEETGLNRKPKTNLDEMTKVSLAVKTVTFAGTNSRLLIEFLNIDYKRLTLNFNAPQSAAAFKKLLETSEIPLMFAAERSWGNISIPASDLLVWSDSKKKLVPIAEIPGLESERMLGPAISVDGSPTEVLDYSKFSRAQQIALNELTRKSLLLNERLIRLQNHMQKNAQYYMVDTKFRPAVQIGLGLGYLGLAIANEYHFRAVRPYLLIKSKSGAVAFVALAEGIAESLLRTAIYREIEKDEQRWSNQSAVANSTELTSINQEIAALAVKTDRLIHQK